MIYLDNNATTLLDPRVLEAMEPLFALPLNVSSIHGWGQKAKGEFAAAHSAIVSALRFQDLVYTSGATEAINYLLQGFTKRGHIISSTLKHVAVQATLQRLEKRGFAVTYLSPLTGQGAITPTQVQEALRPDTTLIALMGANNETGVRTDLQAIAALAERESVAFFVDLVALFGKESFDLPSGVTAFCLSGHKIHGPQGIGLAALRNFPSEPLLLGGPQQQGRRGGTENLPGIVGFARAIVLTLQEIDESAKRMRQLRDKFETALLANLDIVVHGKEEERISNTSNMAFLGVSGETLLIALDQAGIAASSGSACSSGALEVSRVLRSMGISRDVALSSLRFSLSKFTTWAEIERAIDIVTDVVRKIRCS